MIQIHPPINLLQENLDQEGATPMFHHPRHCIINLQFRFLSATGLTSQYRPNQKTALMLQTWPSPLSSSIYIRLLYLMAAFRQLLSEWDAHLFRIIIIIMQLMSTAVDANPTMTTQAC
jgi:hypothetical protein